MKKGFTLIELLIVIGILAILATTVVLVLNPAQLLAQARDTQRISDLSTLKSAVAVYLSTATDPALTAGPYSTANTTCGFGAAACTITTSTVVTGSGWVAIDLTASSGGSPIAVLPIDPTNTATYQYAYKADNTNKTFELNARLESTKYKVRMTADGGDDSTCSSYVEETCYYEVGTDPALDL